jgi:MFS family permease
VAGGLRGIREGWQYARAHDRVFWVIVLMMATVGIGQPAVANLGPTWVTTVVGVPLKYFGLIAITWGVGGILASVYLTRSPDSRQHGVRLVVGAFGFAIAFVVFASGHSVPFAVGGNLGLGFSMSMAQVSASSLLLGIVPNEVRGRVMSLLLLNMGFAQFLTLPLAAVGQATSLEVLFPVLAATCLATVALIVVRNPVIWREPALPDDDLDRDVLRPQPGSA